MLNSYNDLKTYSIRATDQRTGNVDDIYFDDEEWRVLYLVVQTGFLLTARQSLIGTNRVGRPDTDRGEVPVDLTAEELKSADSPQSDPPVSQQMPPAVAAQSMSAWPSFIVGTGLDYSPGLAQDQLSLAAAEAEEAEEHAGDSHLRSMAEVIGYTVHATDGEIGAVDDFLIDPRTWRLQHLVIDTGSWLPGKRVVITTDWIADVDWAERHIRVNAGTQKIEDAPPFDEVEDLKRSPTPDAMASYSALGYWPV
jgi:sporulation protein YlmC with PRC-barrel domain